MEISNGNKCVVILLTLQVSSIHNLLVICWNNEDGGEGCYGDTSNILILNCIKIIDTYKTS